MTLTPSFRPKSCKQCGQSFIPQRSMQSVCGPRCAMQKVRADKAQGKKALRERKAALNDTVPAWIKKADKAFCAYIRLRDQLAGHPCISSGKPLDWADHQVDAGHYRSRGAASHLRYHEDNCHAQSKRENLWRAGNVVEYRIRLIERIGLARVEALESDNRVHQWTVDELKEIEATYKAKKKALESKE